MSLQGGRRFKRGGRDMKKTWMSVVCACLALLLSSCGHVEKSVAREIYIPILADAAWLTADGEFMRGVELAKEDFAEEHKDGGATIKTEVFDDGAVYETGVGLAERIAKDPSVTAVMNLQDFSTSKITAGMLSAAKKVTFFPYGAYDSLFQQDNPYLYCGVPSFARLGKTMADYAVRKGYKRIAVYHSGGQAQEEFVTAFELALMGTNSMVIDYVPSIASAGEFAAAYDRWSILDADCVVVAQYGLDRAYEILSMIRGKNPDLPVIGEPIFNQADALSDNMAIAEGVAVPATLEIGDAAGLAAFRGKYQQRYGTQPDIWAMQGYTMTRLIADTALRVKPGDSAALAEALHDRQGYQGVGGTIAFASGGALVTQGDLSVLVCRDGVFEGNWPSWSDER